MSTSQKSGSDQKFPIVGMGASAGGLEALESFFSYVSDNSGLAYIVLVHSSPDQVSLLPDILQRCTSLTVTLATNGEPLRPDRVYVIPPQTRAYVTETEIELNSLELSQVLSSIDFFFQSLAENHRDRAAGVIFSGMGGDGTLGLRAIKSQEGLAIVQSEESAIYQQMPHSAILSGVVDAILLPEEMPDTISHYFQQRSLPMETTAQGWLNQIFNLLRSQVGHDFSAYKQNTLTRRIKRRMSLQQKEDYRQYLEFLQENPEEIKALFREFLIGVTSFFRDREAFEYLKTEILHPILESFPDNGTFRVWVPGCSTGEEVYSLAMILHEVLDSCSKPINLQIFGTDINPTAIDRAREGLFPATIATEISQERLQRFFDQEGQFYRVGREIRYAVVFSVQNVLKDPPFSRLNLLSCRNLLIYLNESAQKRLLPLFHYTLLRSGILLLGSSETIGSFQDLFLPLSNRWKIFQRRDVARYQRQLLQFPTALFANPPASVQISQPSRQKEAGNLGKLVQRALLEEFVPTAILIDSSGLILHVEGRTGKFLETISGPPTNNILDMAREGLRVELTSAIRTAVSSGETVTRHQIPVRNNGGTQLVKLSVRPLLQPRELAGRFLVLLEQVATETPREINQELSGESVPLEEKDNRIAELEKELQNTRESHQTTIEELESSNEELQATNEELESSNEELQATNEELESSKEELQSLNEELQTVNEELQSKVDELSAAENDMQNLLNSTDIATVFVDNHKQVKRFTPQVTELINLISTDLGRPLVHIATNLDQDIMISSIEQVLNSLTPQIRRVQSREGKWYQMRVLPYRTVSNHIEGAILTFTDIDELKKAQQTLEDVSAELEQAKLALQDIIEANSESLLLLNENQKIIAVSQGFEELVGGFSRRNLTDWEQVISEQLAAQLSTGEDFFNVPLLVNFLGESSDALRARSSTLRVLVDGKVIGNAELLQYILLKIRKESA